MNGDILLQNLINIFIISIILEAAVMAIFSVSALRGMSTNRAVESTRDIIILLVAFFLCFKVMDLRVFVRTGLDIPKMLDIIISSLVLTRMTMFVRTILSRMKGEE